MDNSFAFYIFVIVAIILGVVIVKKVASCLIKSVILLALVALMVYLYIEVFQ